MSARRALAHSSDRRGLQALILPPLRRARASEPGAWSPLMSIRGRPLFEHQLELLTGGAVTDTHIVDSEHATELRSTYGRRPFEHGPRLHYPIRGRRLVGRNAALRAARANLVSSDEIIVCLDANVLTGQQLRPLIRWHLRNASLATLMLVPFAPRDALQVDRLGRIHGVTERPVAGRWTNGGFYVVTPEFFRRLETHGDPEDTTLPQLAREQRLYGLKSRAAWIAVHSSEDAATAAERIPSRT